jgi:hypothetical protein
MNDLVRAEYFWLLLVTIYLILDITKKSTKPIPDIIRLIDYQTLSAALNRVQCVHCYFHLQYLTLKSVHK